jgi:N-acyl amino acid synthase of PEP-CTERM/exosortase system
MPYDLVIREVTDFRRTATNTRKRVPDASLFDVYSEHFMTIPINRADLQEQFYRLRYQVYCVENAFEDRGKHPAGLESDEFDAHSVSSLLIHLPTGMVAGGIRIILPFQNDEPRELPVWRLCNADFDATGDRNRTAEVSRIAVSKQFRQHCAMRPNSNCAETDSLFRVMTQLSLGLLGAVIRMCAEHGITQVCAAMEPSLLRMFSRFGVHLQKLGDLVEYHGWRQPAYANLDRLLARTWLERPDVWAIMTQAGKHWPLNPALAYTSTT